MTPPPPSLKRLPVSASAALAALRKSSRTKADGRDPRAAPKTIHKSFAIAETCRFYGSADAITQCRVPRSCQDCLQMPDCVITQNGQCENVTAPWLDTGSLQDYQHSLNAFPRGDAYNVTKLDKNSYHYFYAANTTYCPTSDPICRDCRKTFLKLASSPRTVDSIGTQFCLGLSGCVCIGVCEVPGLLAVRAFDNQCRDSKSDIPRFVDPDGPDLMGFTSIHRDPRAPLVNTRNQRGEETCAYYPQLDVQGCRKPRSCSDCLKRPGCMINGHTCASMDQYKLKLDFRVREGTTNDKRNFQFPSTNTTYCTSEDPTCKKCRANFKINAKYTGDDNEDYSYRMNATYCVGDNGCVCIELCENESFFLADGKDTECRAGHTRPGFDQIVMIVGFVGAFMLVGAVVLVVRKYLSRSRGDATNQQGLLEPGQGLMRHMLDQAPALNLDLYGWRRFHMELLQKEEELLAGAEDVSPVSRPVDFDFVAPTAPDFEEDESSAPSAQDPTALASAPALNPTGTIGLRRRSRVDLFQAAPTAPDFDDD